MEGCVTTLPSSTLALQNIIVTHGVCQGNPGNYGNLGILSGLRNTEYYWTHYTYYIARMAYFVRGSTSTCSSYGSRA
jgi:hypothetical protein